MEKTHIKNLLYIKKCISYLTIENKEEIPKELQKNMNGYIFGCDICQDVCPWNRFSKPHKEEKFLPNQEIKKYRKKDWIEKLDEPRGALVASVADGSPSDKAGIKAGDIILEFDNEKIKVMKELPIIVARTEVGKKVDVKIWRNKREIIKIVTLGRLETSRAVRQDIGLF